MRRAAALEGLRRPRAARLNIVRVGAVSLAAIRPVLGLPEALVVRLKPGSVTRGVHAKVRAQIWVACRVAGSLSVARAWPQRLRAKGRRGSWPESLPGEATRKQEEGRDKNRDAPATSKKSAKMEE